MTGIVVWFEVTFLDFEGIMTLYLFLKLKLHVFRDVFQIIYRNLQSKRSWDTCGNSE